MSQVRHFAGLAVLALLTTAGLSNANAEEIKTVFVIAMENHNWTQPANPFSGPIQQIFQNPNAPFINSLVNGTATAVINGHTVTSARKRPTPPTTATFWLQPAGTIPTFTLLNPTMSG